MLKSRKTWSIVMAICLCMALMAPIFVAPPAALAASTNTVEQSLIADQRASANLGIIKVVVPNDSLGIASGSQLTVSFPTEVIDRTHDSNAGVGGGLGVAVGQGANYAAAAPTGGVGIVVPATNNAFVAGAGDLACTTTMTNSKFTISLNPGGLAAFSGLAASPSADGVFYIYFYDLDTTQFAGDFIVSLVGNPTGIFTTTPGLTVGKVKKDAGTQTMAKSIVNVTGIGGVTAGTPPTGNGLLNTITVFENAANAIEQGAGDTIELKLMTKGYRWDLTADAVVSDWGFGFGPVAVAPALTAPDTITYTGLVNTIGVPAGGFTTAGLLHFSNLGVIIDDSVARVGQDVEVRIKGDGITEQTFTVAKYCDFEANVLEGTTTEIMAGREEQRIGEFFIEELAPGTLVQDRIITFELPEGYEWDNNTPFGNSNYEVVNSSAITLGNVRYPDAVGKNLGRVMKLEVRAGSGTASHGAKIKFQKLEVMVSPAAKGDLTLEISGKAGVDGTVKVATTVPIVSIEANPVDVVLGIQDQKVGDVILTETAANALVDRRDRTVDQRTIVLQLDEDFAFAKVPTVEVLEGDMILDLQSVRISGDRDNGGRVHIPIKAGSLKQAAKIKISDIYVTANRNAPVGPVKIKVAKARSAVNATNECATGIAIPAYAFQDDSAGNAVLANNLTVPPAENIGATTGEFTIGSNVYKVNGMVKVMDAAPYIKNNRTYVPIRYLGYALGLTDDEIVWDAGNRKATLTKGDTVVELTIGSTTLTVNGEAQTMDVAPEMSNDRTMLPARFVAEAFGAKVGWDAVNRAVVIEN